MNFIYNQIKTFIEISKPVIKNISSEYNIEHDILYNMYILPFEKSLKTFRKQKKSSPYNIFCKNNRDRIKKQYQNELELIEKNNNNFSKSKISKAKFTFITKKLSEEWKSIQKSN